MPLLLLLLLLGVLAYLYWQRRTTNLTRNCRWREERSLGVGHYHCVSCNGRTETPDGQPPRDCAARKPD